MDANIYVQNEHFNNIYNIIKEKTRNDIYVPSED